MGDFNAFRAEADAAEARLGALGARGVALLSLPRPVRDPDALRALAAEIQRGRDGLALIRQRYVVDRGRSDTVRPDRADPAAARHWLEVQRYFMELGERLQLWSQVIRAIREQIDPRPTPLYPRLFDLDTVWVERQRVMDATLLTLHRLANPAEQTPEAREYGCFADIPMIPSIFASHAHAAARVAIAQARPRPLRFIDVGCGGGMKVLMAAQYFEIADGLEYDPAYAAAAERLFQHVGGRTCRAISGDGLTFDAYGDYDVIYFYRPMQDEAALRRLEERIVGDARPGTILIAPYSQFRTSAETLDCVQIEDAVHVVGLTEDEAAALRHEAELTGVHVSTQHDELRAVAGNAAPIIRVCRANGYHPY